MSLLLTNMANEMLLVIWSPTREARERPETSIGFIWFFSLIKFCIMKDKQGAGWSDIWLWSLIQTDESNQRLQSGNSIMVCTMGSFRRVKPFPGFEVQSTPLTCCPCPTVLWQPELHNSSIFFFVSSHRSDTYLISCIVTSHFIQLLRHWKVTDVPILNVWFYMWRHLLHMWVTSGS